MSRIVVGVSGASGMPYAIGLVKVLVVMGVETHLVISSAAWKVMEHEMDAHINIDTNLPRIASHYYSDDHLAAPISSGSFLHHGMVVIPCSMKTLSAIANSYGSNLITRAADVTLKERRKLILVVRETPLHLGHLRNMVKVAEMGGIIMPPSPAFYNKPDKISDLIDHHVGRILDVLGFKNDIVKRWEGPDGFSSN
jgi:4-hydroxy-3-polyprenylbenzoate decarboxylase